VTNERYPGPPSLQAAALPEYAPVYGATVLDLDRSVAAAESPEDLIDLTHGDTRAFLPPDWALPGFDAGVRDNTEAYTAYRGSASLRDVLAPRLAALLGRPVDPHTDMIVTPGSQGGLFAALSALVGPGDVVALADPDYFMNERISRYLGATVERVAPQMSVEGQLDFPASAVASIAAARPRVVLLSNPNNPLGGVYSQPALAAVADQAQTAGSYVIVDQLYCRLVFDGTTYTHLSALPGMAERTVTLLGPSKTESMSGYRVGIAVGPPEVIDQMERVLSLASLRTAGYAQQVLRSWLVDDAKWLAERTAAHQEIRDYVVERLRAVPGVDVATPAGSSYVFPNCAAAVGGCAGDDHALAIRLKQAGVLVSPGYQFGPAGRGHFRVNFSQSPDRVAHAFDRIATVLTEA
jgi:aspartate/methionine/tyrosine aminotransferase